MGKLESQTVIEEILDSPAILFHDQYGEAYIAPQGSGSRIIKLNSRDFKDWLSARCWREYSKALSANMTANIIQTLSGKAKFEGTRYELSVRSAYNDAGVWYDCGAAAVQINKKGWQVVKEPPLLFRRYAHQKKQVLPEKGGDIWSLTNYVNLKKREDQILFIVYTVAAFISGFPHPLLIFHGPQGSGKSTPMRALKELLDPSVIKALSSPRDVGAFAQLAHHHSFVFFDNLSGLPVWLSDALARASTGDGFSKRALWTDDDDIIYGIQRPIALNGINQVITKPDLLDRSILLGLKRIDPTARSSEEDFWAAFNDERPKILGAIFDVISAAMKEYSKVKLDTLPRMADFACWGYAIAEAAGIGGKKFIEAYQANIDKQNDEAIEASPVAQALIEFIRDRDEWKGTAAALLQELKRVSFFDDLQSSPLWPRDPQWLTKRLKEVETNLQNLGIYIDRYMEDQKRITHITKKKPDDDEPDQPDNTKAVETVENQQLPLGVDDKKDDDIDLDKISKFFST